jgi:hypothetical protein
MASDHIPLGNPCVRCWQTPDKHRVYHTPKGNPCSNCGLPIERHYVKHVPTGETDCECGVPYNNHKTRTYSEKERKRKNKRKRKRKDGRKEKDRNHYYIGIDGEGQGRLEHKYILLAASNETGSRSWHVENMNGLSTSACLDFILSLPSKRAKVFSYAFNYDLTKMLTDVDDEKLYKLFRPELRQRAGKEQIKGPKYVYWNGYFLNLQGTKFTVKRGTKRIVIWDIFKFYQSKFVTALAAWKVGEKDRIANMTKMKDKRSEFEKETIEDIKKYCFEECRYMAELARKLIECHSQVGLKLRTLYGAGSSASAMLNVMDIRKKIVKAPDIMKEAIAMAFFGGRFENSVIGQIPGPVYNYDISSAYPYQLCFLPCLMHGHWEKTKSHAQMVESRIALVHYAIPIAHKDESWGPFPFRTEDGSICFPATSGGGWIWKDEYLQGEKLFPNVVFKEAWIYKCECDCQPFSKIPEYYVERLRIGKEGPGIVLKLGPNSCYGKLAQSVGMAPFNSWVWAGLITSGTRAQCLELLALHKDRSNLLMVATDGIKTRERLVTPTPRNTGTFDTIDEHGKKVYKPLGGWEEKEEPKGVFIARPGIYFPMAPTLDELKEVKGRGIGKGTVLENWLLIIESYDKYRDTEVVHIKNLDKFCGAKSSISIAHKDGKPVYHRAQRQHIDAVRFIAKQWGVKSTNISMTRNSYGQWVVRPVDMSFNPMPKRAAVNPDGVTLALRKMPKDLLSMPYNRAKISHDTLMLRAAAQEAIEQPDADLTDFTDE